MMARPSRRWLRVLTAVAVTAGGVLATLDATALPSGPGSVAAAGVAQEGGDGADAAGSDEVVTSVSGAVAQPLVVILDLSGSMTDDDGTGTIKLEGAKEALVSLMRRQPSGAQVGLWTYPGGDIDTGGCEPGSWVPGARLGTVNDPSTLSATIRALAADGDTPTGPALSAVAEQLRQEAITSAVLLLVSDGLSNCGPPPCEVAEELVAQGFDITVQAMGFQMDAAGRQELECIAGVTDGAYFDVNDSEELSSKIQELGVAGLELTVAAPAQAAAGTQVRIRASVTNPSATPIENATVSLVALDAGSRTLFPAVIPPRYRLGNIPAGDTVEREWVLTVGTITQGGAATLRLTASASGVGSTSETRSIVVKGPDELLEAGGWLGEATKHGERIVIMGDSYSAGQGAGSYINGTDQDGNRCHRSYLTYMAPKYPPSQVEVIACSGAVTRDFYQYNHDNSQSPQLADTLIAAINDPVGAVFLTIGGNDIGFANIVKACVLGDCASDSELINKAYKDVAGLGPDLEKAYRDIYDTVNNRTMVANQSSRIVPVVVLPYPFVVPDGSRRGCGDFSSSELAFATDLIAQLDDVIEQAVTKAASGRPGIVYAEGVARAMAGHTVCDSDPYVVNAGLWEGVGRLIGDFFTGNKASDEMMHPNAKGYEAETNAVIGWAQTVTVEGKPAAPVGPAPLTIPRDPNPTVVRVSAAASDVIELRTGDGLRVIGSGFMPGSQVVISINSWRRALGTTYADDAGQIDSVVYVPLDTATGGHTIAVEGFDPELKLLTVDAAVAVGGPVPWWVIPVAIGSGVMALACLLVWALGLRGRLSPRWHRPTKKA